MLKTLRLLFLILISITASSTTLTGTFAYPDGSGVNGKLEIGLYKSGIKDTCNSGAVVPTRKVDVQLINGAVTNSPDFVPNSCLSPTAYYLARVYDTSSGVGVPGGKLLYEDNWYITGSSPQNVGNFLMVMAGPNSTVSVPNPVVMNPTATQIVKEVTGTTFQIQVNSIGYFTVSNTGISAPLINGTRVVDGSTYPTLSSCYTDIPSTGGVCMVPPNYTETLSADITCSKSYSGFIFMGPASIIAGSNKFIVLPNVKGCFIESWVPFGSAVASAGSGVEWNYSGNTTAFLIGGSSSDTLGFRLKDITIFLNNAGSGATALNLIRTVEYEITNLHVIGTGGSTNQQGIILDGTGNYTGGIIIEPFMTGLFKGIQLTGSGTNAGNTNKIIGGQISSPASGSSIGIDFEAASQGNTVFGTDVENHSIAYNFGASSTGNYIVGRSEANTSGATLAAGTSSNEIHLINSLDPITNNGTNNVICSAPQNCIYPLLNITTFKGVGTSNLDIKDGSGNSRVTAIGNGNLFINLGGTATLFNNTNGFIINGSLVSSYNGLSTSDFGLIPVLGTPQHLTGQTANLGTTNLYTSTPVGTYKVCFDARTTTSGSGTIGTVVVSWTDEGGVKTFTSSTWALNSVTITGEVDNCKIIHVSASSNIQISVNGTFGTSVYALDAWVEREN